jgi:hypothetical protein
MWPVYNPDSEPMTDENRPTEPTFLDVEALLSMPIGAGRSRGNYAVYFVGGFLLVMLAMALTSGASPEFKGAAQGLALMLGVGLVGAMAASSFVAVRAHRAEQKRLEAVEEMIQLRNWPGAAVAVDRMLAGPIRNPAVRVRGLMFLASVLARYARFDDAIKVHEFLLDHVALDDGTAYGLRLGRVMAMLHEDHLFDADRAIGELRRAGDRDNSAGLALVEIYRDVKTGHLAEAIGTFESKLGLMREKLGHRVADAYALIARAFDLLEREDEARVAWTRATLLAPAIELTRRYPETTKTAAKYTASPAPVGM